jgi:hypothetical protein
MKEVVDMTPEEYKKFILQSGVGNDTHGGGKIISMSSAEGADVEMTARERLTTGAGIAIGGAGFLIAVDMILTKMKKKNFPMIGFIAILLVGAVAGGYAGNKLGKKWQASVDNKK